MKKLEFYFDFLSPFSYFAWKNHEQALKEFDLELLYRPVLMGRLFSMHGFPGPGEIEAKRDYELKKCFRYAQKNHIDFTPPSQFPFNPMAIIRTATIAAAKDEQKAVIDFVFKQIWSEGKVLDDPEAITEIFKTQGFNEAVVHNSFNREAKSELKANIKAALAKGIFGVPSFSLEDETEYFWGNDSFEDLVNYLAGDDKWNKSLYNEVLANNQMKRPEKENR